MCYNAKCQIPYFTFRVGILINKVSISSQVYALLRDRIVRRVMVPGERVHIDALAEELGVSRTPIKDARFFGDHGSGHDICCRYIDPP